MDTRNLRGFMEAYSEMYAPQEVEEAVKGESSERRKDLAAERRAGTKPLSPSKGKGYADQQKQQIAYMDKVTKKNKNVVGLVTKEELDIFDVVLEFLQAEGYAETLEEAEWMMANLIDEEAIAIILGEEQLDELSNRTVSNALNARIAATGAASDRAYQNRNPQAMRAAETAADKEASMRGAVAKRRERMNKEEFELDEAITSEKGKAKAAEMIAKRSTPSGRAKSGKGANVAQIRQIRGSGRGSFDREGLGGTPMTPTMAKNPIKKQNYDGTGNKAARRAGTYQEAFESWLDEAMTNYEKNRKRAAQRAAARNAARDQGKTGAVPGVGYVTPRRERETWTDESGKTRHAKGL